MGVAGESRWVVRVRADGWCGACGEAEGQGRATDGQPASPPMQARQHASNRSAQQRLHFPERTLGGVGVVAVHLQAATRKRGQNSYFWGRRAEPSSQPGTPTPSPCGCGMPPPATPCSSSCLNQVANPPGPAPQSSAAFPAAGRWCPPTQRPRAPCEAGSVMLRRQDSKPSPAAASQASTLAHMLAWMHMHSACSTALHAPETVPLRHCRHFWHRIHSARPRGANGGHHEAGQQARRQVGLDGRLQRVWLQRVAVLGVGGQHAQVVHPRHHRRLLDCGPGAEVVGGGGGGWRGGGRALSGITAIGVRQGTPSRAACRSNHHPPASPSPTLSPELCAWSEQ